MKRKRPIPRTLHLPSNAGHAPLAAWLHSVSGAGEQLQQMIRSSEGEFLLVGRTLGQCHAKARQLDGLSSAISGIMTGPQIAQAVDDLNGLIGDMENYLGRTATGTSALLAALREIIERAAGLRRPLADFLAIARTMRSMAATARDHHAETVGDDRDVIGLLNEAHNLSEIMATRAGALMEGLGDLEERLELARRQCADFEETRLARLQMMIGDTTAVLCSLTEQYGRAAVASKAVVKRSALIARSTGEIVVSCQFHDITRQQFEKVQHALVEVSQHLTAVAEGRAVLPPEDEAGLAAEVGHFSARCADNLGAIRDRFVSSVEEITSNLRRIADDAGAMAREMRRMAEDPRSGQRSLLRVVGDVLRSVRATLAALAESAQAQDLMSDTVAELSGTAAGMAGFLADLNEITRDIESMAVHTEARVSEGGWSAPAVVGKLQLLAAETCARARSVAGGLAAFSSVVGELAKSQSGEEPRHGEWVQSMARHLDGLVTLLTQLNERIISLIGEVDETGSSLAGEIGQLVDQVSVHRLVDTAVCGFVGVLREVASAAGTPAAQEENAAPRWLPGIASLHMDGSSNNGQGQGARGVEFF